MKNTIYLIGIVTVPICRGNLELNKGPTQPFLCVCFRTELNTEHEQSTQLELTMLQGLRT